MRSSSPYPSAKAGWQVSFGRWLFSHRSLTPLPLILAVFFYLMLDNAGRIDVSSSLARGLGWAALALLAAGEAIRLAVVGRAPPGTSGRGRRLEARVLVTWGPYAFTRNPLYFGNLLMCLGLLLEVRSIPVAIGALLFFYLQYAPVIRAEEAFLRDRFGAAYDAWFARVPRFWPGWPRAGGGGEEAEGHRGGGARRPPIRWGEAIVRDADTWFAGFGGLELWRWWTGATPRIGGLSPALPLGLLATVYLSIKAVKRLRRRRRMEGR